MTNKNYIETCEFCKSEYDSMIASYGYAKKNFCCTDCRVKYIEEHGWVSNKFCDWELMPDNGKI